MATSSADNPIIVALDQPDAVAALALVDRLQPAFDFFKIGSRLFVNDGKGLVETLIGRSARVFVDLKFHDIPDQVAGSARAVASMGAAMFTVHSLGGRAMMAAAVKAARERAEELGTEPPAILAVTVLTSHGEGLSELGVSGDVETEVLKLAGLALEAGVDGVVASPREVEVLRKAYGRDFLIVTPGIRSSGQELGDQARAAAPMDAIKAGADFLVVGRPITAAGSPEEVAATMLKEALDGRKS